MINIINTGKEKDTTSIEGSLSLNSYLYQVLILLLFIQTHKTISKPNTLGATTSPAVAGFDSFERRYRTQKLVEGRRKTEVRQEETVILKMK